MSSNNPTVIYFITGNRNKFAETEAILGDSVQLLMHSIEIPEIQGSLEDIALDKCRKAAIAVSKHSAFYIKRSE